MIRKTVATGLIFSLALISGCWSEKLESGSPDLRTFLGIGINSMPHIVSVTPVNGATDIGPATTIEARFNKTMDPGSINAGTFTLKDALFVPVSGTVLYNNATRTAVFTPDAALNDLENYTAWISGLIMDMESNPLGADYTWSFKTGTTEFAGGDGTGANPFQVATPAHLYNVRYHPSAYFIQTANINLGIAPYNAGSGWEPIGNSTTRFIGTYNGNNRIISNLFIDRPTENNIGLFGYTDGSVIRNLTLDSVSVTGNTNVGGLIGYSSDTSHRIAYPAPSVENCYLNNVNVSGTSSVGGLAGYNRGGTASSYRSLIKNSFAVGTVTATGTNAGGLVGTNVYYATISMSFADTIVSGTDFVGGLTGITTYTAKINTSYAVGLVSGSTRVGGLSGSAEASAVSGSYSACAVSGTLPDTGGLIGSGGTSTLSSYYDSDVSGLSDSDRGLPMTTAQMTQQATYMVWDFVSTWTIINGVSYPYFNWQGGTNIPVP